MINTGTPVGVALGRAGDVVEVKMTVSAASGKCSGRPEVRGFGGIRALVTGGASGIVLAAAQRLAREAAMVAVLDRARQGPDDLIYMRADVTDDDAEWHRVLDVNVLGLVRVTRAALPVLRRSSAAAIVNTCSIAATAGLPNRALYLASKGAVLSLTLAMAGLRLRPRS